MNYNLSYRDGQWSPFNTNGNKVYDKDFLLFLRSSPNSNEKPDNIPPNIMAQHSPLVTSTVQSPLAFAMPLNQPIQHGAHTKSKSRSRALPIIDPSTGNYLCEQDLDNKSYGDTSQASMATDVVISRDISENVPQSVLILEKYLNSDYSIEEVEQKIKTSTSVSERPQLMTDGSLYVLQTTKKTRLQTGYLFANLIKPGIFSVENYSTSLETVFKEADELIIDIPKVWDYVAELVFPVFCHGVIENKNIQKLFNLLIKKTHASKLLACLFKMLIEENEESNSLTLTDYTSMVSDTYEIDEIPVLSLSVEKIPEQPEAQLNKILEEYLNDRCSVQECLQHIQTSIAPSETAQLVSVGSMSVLRKSKVSRLRLGFLFARLIKLNILSIQNYCVGLEALLKKTDQLVIEMPKIWNSVAELISPVVCENAVTLRDLQNSFKLLISENNGASELLKCLFKLIIQSKNIQFLQNIWTNSNLSFGDYMDESQVDNYIKENNFEFLLETGDSSPVSQSSLLEQSQLSYEEIHDKLLSFFQSGTSFDVIINWIADNVGERIKENQFIRTLVTACFNDSIVNLKLKPDILQGKYNLLHRFVDNKFSYELECLFALQTLINKLEHPQGLLLAIFDKLYEENVFSHESFLAWEVSKDPAEQEGKVVALKQLTNFFAQLKEIDEDSSLSEEA